MTQSGAGSGHPGYTSPSMYPRISRPCSSMPRARGASNPAPSRNRSRAWTAGVHGPARRLTMSPARVASLRFPPMKGSSFMAVASGELDVAEGLRGREIPGCSGVLGPPTHALGESLAPADLALVRPECRDLLVDRRRDVEPDVRVARAEEQHPRDTVVPQAAGELLRKEKVVARGDDAVERAPAGDTMIGVHLVMTPWVVREHHVGLVLPDHQADLRA